jgi:GT2 family glycosyltransferase
MKDDSKILIIAVIYNTFNQCKLYVESIESQLSDKIKLVLVDNSEYENSEFSRWVSEKDSLITYIRTGSNLGYFGGVRFGIESSPFMNLKPDWLIISNVDIQINQKDFFEKLLQFNKLNDLGCLAPIIFSGLHNQNLNPKYLSKPSYKKIKFLKNIFSNVISLNAYVLLSAFTQIIRKSNKRKFELKDGELLQIYAPHGSFIILHSNYFKLKGTLNNPSFLFGEEFFLAEECIKNNLKVYYTEQLRVEDFPHSSTGLFRRRKISKLMYKSVCDILFNYYKFY